MSTSLITTGVQFPDGTLMNSLSETERQVPVSTSTTTINLNTGDGATFFKLNVASSSTITFSNPPNASNTVFSFTMMTVNAGSGYTLTYGNTIKWPGGVVPSRTTATGAVNVWSFFIEANTYYGSLSIANAS
jgi:hypothetical protein